MNPILVQFFIVFALSVPVFMILDIVWVRTVSKDFYLKYSGHLRGEHNTIAITLSYTIMLMGLTFFAMYPTVSRGTVQTGLILGAFYGFFTFAMYNFANMSSIKEWSLPFVLVDIVWGTALSAFTTVATFVLYIRFFG